MKCLLIGTFLIGSIQAANISVIGMSTMTHLILYKGAKIDNFDVDDNLLGSL